MRIAVKMILCGLVFITACRDHGGLTPALADGVYVNHAESEYAVADDTLTLRLRGNDHYLITRKTGYQAIREGQLLPKKHKLEKVEGDLDSKTNMLNETTTGRVYRFDPDKGVLILKQAVYRRLN